MDSSVLDLMPPVSKSTPLFKTTTKPNETLPGSYNQGQTQKPKAKPPKSLMPPGGC